MEYVIETQNLVKQYKTKSAVNDVSIQVARGEIYGLIGKNGAGKTTLMRLLVGLATPTSGKVLLFGKENNLVDRAKIGTLIESPALIKNCSAYENMLRFSIICGADKNQIQSILQLVGLSNTGNKRVSQFSLGMKQRLGLAIALLANPEVLILDEPINGLDPAGIKEIRDIILELNAKGVTFIISSHLLDELAKVVTRYGILAEGNLVEEITADELQAKVCQKAKIVCNDANRALALLKANFPDIQAQIVNDGIVISSHVDKRGEINAMLIKSGINVTELKLSKKGLENFFLERLGQ